MGLRARLTDSAKPSGSQRVVYATTYSVVFSEQLTQYPTPPLSNLLEATPNVFSHRLILAVMSRLCRLFGNHLQHLAYV